MKPEIFLYLVTPVIAGIVVTMFHKPLQKFRDWAFADENLPPEKITFKITEHITETHSENAHSNKEVFHLLNQTA